MVSLLPYQEALEILLSHGRAAPLSSEKIALADIPGRVCAEKITAPIANQPFDNSSMDGFAVRTEDLPATLEIIGHLAAGHAPVTAPLQAGQCYEIMTGAPMPQGADAVVPVEKTARAPDGGVIFQAAPKKGEFIRRAGADFAVGDAVLDKGAVLDAGHALALATLGIGQVTAVRRLRAAVISTGSEVVDDLDTPLTGGRIYNSTRPYLRLMLPHLGIEKIALGTVEDDPALYKSKLNMAAGEGCDLIISTGAVSAGVHDFVPAVLKELGAETFFHRIAIRPGRPVLFARLPNGGPFFLGLPGNPVSTAAGLRFFVQPLMRAMQGLPPEMPRHAVLARDYAKTPADLRFFLRAALAVNAQGVNEVRIIPDQQSFKVSPFLASNAWVVVPEGVSQLKAGDLIELYP